MTDTQFFKVVTDRTTFFIEDADFAAAIDHANIVCHRFALTWHSIERVSPADVPPPPHES